jgi:hypothetical protein
MPDRAIFNRKYTSFTPGGTQVWLVNGAGVTTTFPTSQNFTAGENLIQGQVVYVSGTSVFSATALSGVPATRYQAIGITTAAATAATSVTVTTDDVAVLNSANITAETALIPGEYYYLSKYSGQVTRYTTASGTVSASGTNQYQVIAGVGIALSTTELEVEIDVPILIYS